jgi:preprotein translocase subunit SecD
MKRAKKPVFFIVALLILFFTYASIFGIKGKNGDNTVTYIKGVNDIRWGIDIHGGVEATFAPATSTKPTNAQMDAAESIIEQRLVLENITDYELYKDYNHSRIIVRFPWKTDEKDFDPEKSIEELAATAQVTFREGMEYTTETTGSDGEPIYKTPKGKTASTIILQGSDIVKAEPQITTNPTTGTSTYVVTLKLSSDGAKKFAEATKRLKDQIISIWMDDTMISWPKVNQVITNGECEIEGGSKGFTAAEASSLANKINAGALPFKLTVTNSNTISPTLGQSSLRAMLVAGIIAFFACCVVHANCFPPAGFCGNHFPAWADCFVLCGSFRFLPVCKQLYADAPRYCWYHPFPSAWASTRTSLRQPASRKSCGWAKRLIALLQKATTTAFPQFSTATSRSSSWL